MSAIDAVIDACRLLDAKDAEIARLREALEAVQSEILLTGHLAEIVEAALTQH